jgi:SAM-dependent methyltransferase
VDLVEVSSAPWARRHPWETARFEFFRGVLLRRRLLQPGTRVLDVGAGDAWFASELARLPEGPRVVAWDVAYEAGRRPSDRGSVSFVDRAPCDAFEVVLLLDVLEHVEDDSGFLAEIVRRNVAPRGHVLVSVPAWPRLFGTHDTRLGHQRRYAPRAARALLERSGLDVLVAGGLFHSLLPIRAMLNVLERRTGRPPPLAGEWRGAGATTATARALLRTEGRLSYGAACIGLDVPGLSWWALCKPRAR